MRLLKVGSHTAGAETNSGAPPPFSPLALANANSLIEAHVKDVNSLTATVVLSPDVAVNYIHNRPVCFAVPSIHSRTLISTEVIVYVCPHASLCVFSETQCHRRTDR